MGVLDIEGEEAGESLECCRVEFERDSDSRPGRDFCRHDKHTDEWRGNQAGVWEGRVTPTWNHNV